MRLYHYVSVVASTVMVMLSLLLGPGTAIAQPTQKNDMSANIHMDMTDSGPAHFKPTREAYTTNHRFLVKLTQLPQPIPYQKYFTIRFEVYDGHHPSQRMHNVKLSLFAGMRHGLKHGFAHGMESSPKIIDHNGVFTVEGMYFHMMGKWTLKVTARDAGQTGIAYFDLPCCAL